MTDTLRPSTPTEAVDHYLGGTRPEQAARLGISPQLWYAQRHQGSVGSVVIARWIAALSTPGAPVSIVCDSDGWRVAAD